MKSIGKNIGYGQIIITYVIPIFCILYKRAIDLPIFSWKTFAGSIFDDIGSDTQSGQCAQKYSQGVCFNWNSSHINFFENNST